MNSLDCKYCKYYEYDYDLTRVYWKLTQDEKENVPKIGRCTYGGKTIGNAVLSDGYHSDGHDKGYRGIDGCDYFEHRGSEEDMSYRRYDVFEFIGEKHNTVVWIDQVQYEYAPKIYRMASIGHGGWSEDAETLSDPNKYRFMWRREEKKDEV